MRRRDFINACSNGNLALAKEIYSRCRVNTYEAFRAACINGHLPVAKWIYTLGDIDGNDCNQIIYDMSYVNVDVDGDVDIDIVQWLFTHAEFKFNDTFRDACKSGDLQSVKWLHSIAPALGGINDNYRVGFHNACCNGNLPVAKWLYEIGAVNTYDSLFTHTSEDGHLPVMKWLHSLGGISQDAYNDAFTNACMEGHLDIAKWLYEVTTIDVNANDNEAFHQACMSDHLIVAKWLYEIANGSISKDVLRHAFYLTCKPDPWDVMMLKDHSDNDWWTLQPEKREIPKWLIYLSVIPEQDNVHYPYYQRITAAANKIRQWFRYYYAMKSIDR